MGRGTPGNRLYFFGFASAPRGPRATAEGEAPGARSPVGPPRVAPGAGELGREGRERKRAAGQKNHNPTLLYTYDTTSQAIVV